MSARPLCPKRCATAAACLLAVLALAGCHLFAPPKPEPPPPEGLPPPEPLPIQQARAYPETVTGLFMSLVDFETLPGSPPGHEQVGYFAFSPRHEENAAKFVVNVTRTGAGAMEVRYVAGSVLVLRVPFLNDFTGYTLLTFALHSQTLRDDLRVTLTSGSASWTSHRTLVRPGWNYVLIDIQRLAREPAFDIKNVQTVRLAFTDLERDVHFHLDDIMLVTNQRRLKPVPRGLTVVKTGLDYRLSGPAFPLPVPIAQSADGLWRLGPYQAAVQVAAPGVAPAGEGEDLDLLGQRRVGHVEILEASAVRMRVANIWYFPTRAGEWVSLAIRQIRWDHTLYADGRWATHMELNNAGGRKIGSLRVSFPRPVAIVGAGIEKVLTARGLPGPIGRWNFLWAPPTRDGQVMLRNFLTPPRLRITLGQPQAYAVGDTNRDRFDESQGCYFLQADRGGHCRFVITPGAEGLVKPVFRVAGTWTGPVHVQSEGLRIPDVTALADGTILFALPGRLTRPTAVEITGKTPLLQE